MVPISLSVLPAFSDQHRQYDHPDYKKDPGQEHKVKPDLQSAERKVLLNKPKTFCSIEKTISIWSFTDRIMKEPVLVFITIIVVFLAASGCVSAPAGPAPAATTSVPQEARPHYIIGVDGDFPPFTSQDGGGNFSGFDIEAARYVAGWEGFDVTFVAVPWDSVVSLLGAKKIDIIWSGMTVTEDRKAQVNFSVPYYTVNQSIAVRAGSNFTMQDFSAGRLRIGAQAGSTEADWVLADLVRTGKMPAANLILYPDITALTSNLENGTVDASIIQAPAQQGEIAGRPLKIIGETPVQETYAVAVRKADPELLARINDGLMQLMKDPYWQQLLQKHGLGQ